MKNNHTPVTVRLQRRLHRLEDRLPGTRPIGGGNPYHCCTDCGRSEPDVSNNGHFRGCSRPGILKEIQHYLGLLLVAEREAAMARLHQADHAARKASRAVFDHQSQSHTTNTHVRHS